MIRRFPNRASAYWQLVPAYLGSMVDARARRALFDQVETYCMFIGYPRSGHSLVGSLLDAHPDAVVSHELDTLGFLQAGFSRSQIFSLILENSRQAAAEGRTQTGYSYAVPGGWQGRVRTLRVIGDKRAGGSGRRLLRRPALVDRLQRTVGVPVRFLHVLRNPFDNISTIAVRGRMTPREACEVYFPLCDGVAGVKSRVPPGAVLDVRHESLIADPRTALRGLCGFLGIEASDGYVERCASIVFASPHQSRREVEWSADLHDEVSRRMRAYPFLEGYTWES